MQKHNSSNIKKHFGWEGRGECASRLFSWTAEVKVTFAETSIAALTEHIPQFA